MPKTVYVIMIADRHSDTTPEVWLDKEKAIRAAKKHAWEMARNYRQEPKVREIPAWIYYAECSVESDCVWLIERELYE